MLSVVIQTLVYADYHNRVQYAECRWDECHYAECRGISSNYCFKALKRI
jgi:hypothetical protein